MLLVLLIARSGTIWGVFPQEWHSQGNSQTLVALKNFLWQTRDVSVWNHSADGVLAVPPAFPLGNSYVPALLKNPARSLNVGVS